MINENKELNKTIWTNINSSSVNTLTIDKLNKMYDLMSKTKIMVIFFTPLVQDRILFGEWVDKMLVCEKNEEGFIVPEKYRVPLSEYKNSYKEWVWKAPRLWEEMKVGFKYQEE